jgi:hypothetical protein
MGDIDINLGDIDISTSSRDISTSSSGARRLVHFGCKDKGRVVRLGTVLASAYTFALLGRFLPDSRPPWQHWRPSFQWAIAARSRQCGPKCGTQAYPSRRKAANSRRKRPSVWWQLTGESRRILRSSLVEVRRDPQLTSKSSSSPSGGSGASGAEGGAEPPPRRCFMRAS